jgi:hypothetical protein
MTLKIARSFDNISPIRTTIKYINHTVEALKGSSFDSYLTIIEQLLVHGMNPSDVTTMVIDMLMAGVDTASHHITIK